jgi:hypothetical protein
MLHGRGRRIVSFGEINDRGVLRICIAAILGRRRFEEGGHGGIGVPSRRLKQWRDN